MRSVTRRHVLGTAGGIALSALAGSAFAQSADKDLLARLRAAKKVRVGIANQMPYSALNPDGSVTGVAPDITKAIMGRLGITDIEGVIGSYGELIPGLLAGRWDFVSACLTITPARCGQVLFADPLVWDGTAIVSLKGSTSLAPKSLHDLATLNVTVAVQAGGALSRALRAAGVQLTNMQQFADDPAIIDALVAKRAQFAAMSYAPLKALFERRNVDMTVVYPTPDDPARGAGSCFRPGDTDLHAAYQKELRAMKASGEYLNIVTKYGFDTPPELINVTSEQACKAKA
jgi:polar amino acid transport system substrate-binding protein